MVFAKTGKIRKIRLETVILQLVLILLSLVYIVPFLWLVLGSLKTNTELFATPTVWIPAIPQWSNYINAIQSFPFLLYLKNTLLIIGYGIIGSLLSNSLIAYGFSCIDWRGRNALFMVSLTGIMMVPLLRKCFCAQITSHYGPISKISVSNCIGEKSLALEDFRIAACTRSVGCYLALKRR